MKIRASRLVLLILALNCAIHGVLVREFAHVFLSLALICVITLITKVRKSYENSE